MKTQLNLQIGGWVDGGRIPAKYAFGQPGNGEPFALSGNISPAVRWEDAPPETQSFALICSDPDVPSNAKDVNQAGKTVPADLARIQFFHWVLVNIPHDVRSIVEGAASQSVVARGKPHGPSKIGLSGINDYSAWFAGDPDMEGYYGAYDGPCPPWNDSIVHHYHFELYALDIPKLNVSGAFDGREALKAMQGHILAKACYTGTYSMNPQVV